MKLIRIAEALEARIAYGPAAWEQINIESIFTSDLMSDILMSDLDNILIVTSLSTEQSIRSAGMVNSEAVVITNNKAVTDGMVVLAEELEIALFCVNFPTYETCVRLGRIMKT